MAGIKANLAMDRQANPIGSNDDETLRMHDECKNRDIAIFTIYSKLI